MNKYPPPSPHDTKYVWPIYSAFIIFLISPYFPAEIITFINIYFMILVSIFFIIRRRVLPKSLFLIAGCFLLMIVTGTISSIDNNRDNYYKDVWYFFNPVLIIFIGYTFGCLSPNVTGIIKMFIYASTVQAIFHISNFIIDPQLFSMTATDIRKEVGGGVLGAAVSFAFLLAALGDWRKSLKMPIYIFCIAFFLCAVSFILSFSRTSIIACLLMYFGLKGYLWGRHLGKLIAFSGILIILLISISFSINSLTENNLSFLGKIMRIEQELTIADFSDKTSITLNFRGYETARTLIAYKEGNIFNLFFGHGLGYEVDLGIYIPLAGKPQRYITHLHNGIMFVLVKTGALGLVLFLYVFFWIFWRARKEIDTENSGLKVNRIIQGIVAFCLVSTWIVSGPFNKSLLLGMEILLGFSLAILERKNLQRLQEAAKPCIERANTDPAIR